MMKRSRWWLLLGVAILMTGVAPQRVFAHPEIIRTVPEAGSVLSASPDEILVVFNEPVEDTFSSLELLNSQSQRVDAGGGGRSTTDDTTLRVAIPALEPGVYTAVWQVVGSDGHKIRGNFVFTLRGEPTMTPLVRQSLPTPGLTPTATPTPEPLVPAVIPPADDGVDHSAPRLRPVNICALQSGASCAGTPSAGVGLSAG